MSLRNLADPVMLVRSPTLTNSDSSVMLNGSRPESRQAGARVGTSRGGLPLVAAAIAVVWLGVVPQQPPTRLTSPLAANSSSTSAVSSGDSSYSPNALGR